MYIIMNIAVQLGDNIPAGIKHEPVQFPHYSIDDINSTSDFLDI